MSVDRVPHAGGPELRHARLADRFSQYMPWLVGCNRSSGNNSSPKMTPGDGSLLDEVEAHSLTHSLVHVATERRRTKARKDGRKFKFRVFRLSPRAFAGVTSVSQYPRLPYYRIVHVLCSDTRGEFDCWAVLHLPYANGRSPAALTVSGKVSADLMMFVY